MLIIQVVNGEVIGNPVHYREIFGNLSDVSYEQLSSQNYFKINLFRDHNKLTQKLITCAPVYEDPWVYTVEVQDMTDQEIQQAKDSVMDTIRRSRNNLLSASDWTQISDSTANKELWATYRQALRDLPATIGDADPRTWNNWPHDPNWVSPN